MPLTIMNVLLFLISSLMAAHAASTFMDDYPSCNHYIQAPTGPLKSYEDIYYQLYRRGEGKLEKFMDQNILSAQRFYPRCGSLGAPGVPYFPTEGEVEQNERMWPWLVWFMTDVNCFGVYISPEWILTTASCIKSNLVMIRRPSYLLKGKIILNSNFRLQEDYDRVNNEFDIALIHVIQYGYTHPVCIPMIGVPFTLEFDRCFFIGFKTKSSNLIIFQMKVTFLESTKCSDLLKNMSVSSLTNTCMKPDLENSVFPDFSRGHAGLPVNCFFGFAWHVIGLTSPKQPIDNKVLVLTNVTFFDPWIREMASETV